MSFSEGMEVWVRDPQVEWARLKVISSTATHVTVEVDYEEKEVPVCDVLNCNPNIEKNFENLITLGEGDYLNEPCILETLDLRNQDDNIYTYFGTNLISVNPFKRLTIYSDKTVAQYGNKALGALPPHIYAISDVAYRTMVNDKVNQSIIVSGESGSGKTEANKVILQYLAHHAGRPSNSGKKGGDQSISKISEQIVKTSPVLEAFGNAKTIRNDNSSRFGKLMEVQFDGQGIMIGAKIVNYLLEKSRIVYQAPYERNYHVFYQLCAGMSREERDKYKVQDASKYAYLAHGESAQIKGVDDSAEFKELKNAMDTIGFDSSEKDSIFRIISFVLLLGNINFVPNADDTATVKDSSVVGASSLLIQVDSTELESALVNKTIHTRDGAIKTKLSLSGAADTRDALAKGIYGRLFDWLVVRLNTSIAQESCKSFIDVLDIFGFEIFEINRFEQLCINFANEKLQQQFITHVIKGEQEEYKRERIPWADIQFIDNASCLDLIEKSDKKDTKSLGILALLDEECRVPKGTDEGFLQKVIEKHSNKHPNFVKPRLSNTAFLIKHYAGDVAYEVASFLEKNKDPFSGDLLAVLLKSGDAVVRGIMAEDAQGGAAQTTVSSKFKSQLQSLYNQLSSAQPHYIRCIKPNMLKVPDKFDPCQVVRQLRCSGVLESLRIRQAGYPVRVVFDNFVKRYKCMVPRAVLGTKVKGVACEAILKHLLGDKHGPIRIGVTKVFLKAEQATVLEKLMRERAEKGIRKVQQYMRFWRQRNQYRRMKKSASFLQKWIREFKNQAERREEGRRLRRIAQETMKKARAEKEAARLKAEAERKEREKAEKEQQQKQEREKEAARLKAEAERKEREKAEKEEEQKRELEAQEKKLRAEKDAKDRKQREEMAKVAEQARIEKEKRDAAEAVLGRWGIADLICDPLPTESDPASMKTKVDENFEKIGAHVISRLVALHGDDSLWDVKSFDQGAVLLEHKKNSKYLMGQATIDGTPREAFNLVWDHEQRIDWDSDYVTSSTVADLDGRTKLVSLTCKVMSGADPRVFALFTTYRVNEHNGTVYVAYVSIPHPRNLTIRVSADPLSAGAEPGTFDISGFIIQPSPQGHAFTLSHIVNMAPGGWIPNFLVRSANEKQALLVDVIRQFIAGAPIDESEIVEAPDFYVQPKAQAAAGPATAAPSSSPSLSATPSSLSPPPMNRAGSGRFFPVSTTVDPERNTGKGAEVANWLEDIGLPKYKEGFINNGFDDVSLLPDMEVSDLDLIGVKLPGHRKKLLMAAHALPRT